MGVTDLESPSRSGSVYFVQQGLALSAALATGTTQKMLAQCGSLPASDSAFKNRHTLASKHHTYKEANSAKANRARPATPNHINHALSHHSFGIY